MQLTGKLIKALPATSGISQAGKAWRKQEFVIETEERYPKQVCFDVMNDNIDKFTAIQIGQTITIDFELRSREHEGKYYTNVSAWNVRF